jgi:hypothetical protein
MDVMLGVMKPRRLSQTMIVAIKDAERCSHAELPGATFRVLLPHVGEATLYRVARLRRIASRLNRLSAHDNGDVTVDSNPLDPALKQRIVDHAVVHQVQDDRSVG